MNALLIRKKLLSGWGGMCSAESDEMQFSLYELENVILVKGKKIKKYRIQKITE